MAWDTSNASRRQLLGQLSGQFADLARTKAQRRSQTQDVLAGFGQQAMGILGQQKLETQRQTGAERLAGQEAGYRTEEERLRQGLQGERERGLQGMIQDFQREYPDIQEKARLDAILREIEASGLTPMEFYYGYPPQGKEDTSDMEKALSDPLSWAVTMLYTYKSDRNLLNTLKPGEVLPQNLEADFRTYGKDFVDLQFPEMSEFDKNRLKAAIDKVISRPEVAEEGGGTTGGGGYSRWIQLKNEQTIASESIVPLLRKRRSQEKRGSATWNEIGRLLTEIIPPGNNINTRDSWENWKSRADAILNPSAPTQSILEQERGGVPQTLSPAPPVKPIERLRETLRSLIK